MTRYVTLKTNRTKSGEANAKISRYMNYSTNKIRYGFQFYRKYAFFDTHEELRKFVLDNYNVDIGDKDSVWWI